MKAHFNLISKVAVAAWPILRVIFCILVLICLIRYTRRDASLAARVEAAERRAVRAERAALQYYTLGESSYHKLYKLMKTKRYRRLLKICARLNDRPNLSAETTLK